MSFQRRTIWVTNTQFDRAAQDTVLHRIRFSARVGQAPPACEQ
jgi:hypothetical protein